jgi:hypothetical protein
MYQLDAQTRSSLNAIDEANEDSVEPYAAEPSTSGPSAFVRAESVKSNAPTIVEESGCHNTGMQIVAVRLCCVCSFPTPISADTAPVPNQNCAMYSFELVAVRLRLGANCKCVLEFDSMGVAGEILRYHNKPLRVRPRRYTDQMVR